MRSKCFIEFLEFFIEYWRFLLEVFGEMVGVGGVLVAFQSLPTIKKDISPFNFQLNEPFLKFLRQPLQYEAPWSKTKKKKIKYYILSTSLFT